MGKNSCQLSPLTLRVQPEEQEEADELARAGSMAPAEFDRIWFLRMPTLPRLSLLEDDTCPGDACVSGADDTASLMNGDSDCDRLLPAVSLLKSLRTNVVGNVAPSPPPAVVITKDQSVSGVAGDMDRRTVEAPAPLAGPEDAGPLPHKKSRWRNKTGGLCSIF